jgi:hypothetical protein
MALHIAPLPSRVPQRCPRLLRVATRLLMTHIGLVNVVLVYGVTRSTRRMLLLLVGLFPFGGSPGEASDISNPQHDPLPLAKSAKRPTVI